MPEPALSDLEQTRDARRAYWRANVRIVLTLLAVWALVSFGCGIWFKGFLDRFTLPGTGFKLGFWFAQQGSIYVFVVLIFVYVWLMNRLDKKFDVHEGDTDARSHGTGGGAH